MAATLILGCFTVTSFGATTTKTMTTYSKVIKSGKYAYCAAGTRVYRVNLNTKSKKRLAKTSGYVTDMKLYKGYVYFNISYPASTRLYRVKKEWYEILVRKKYPEEADAVSEPKKTPGKRGPMTKLDDKAKCMIDDLKDVLDL